MMISQYQQLLLEAETELFSIYTQLLRI